MVHALFTLYLKLRHPDLTQDFGRRGLTLRSALYVLVIHRDCHVARSSLLAMTESTPPSS